MTTEARVTHRSPGRCRLRLPQMRGDTVFFGGLARELEAELAGTSVVCNARTASVLLTGDVPDDDELQDFGREKGWFELTGAGTEYARPAVDLELPFDLASADVRRLFMITFVGLAAVQVVRGQIMVPATSFLWYALAASALPADPA